MARKCCDVTLNTLKTAFKLTLGDVGGLDAATTVTRVGRSQLAAYGDIHSDRMPPVDVVLDLEAIGGEPRMTAALAAAHGYELAPLEGRPTHELAACLAEAATDCGQLLSDAVRLMGQAPGTRRRETVRDVRRDLHELVRMARETLRALDAEEGE
jgi:hypothetical protein